MFRELAGSESIQIMSGNIYFDVQKWSTIPLHWAPLWGGLPSRKRVPNRFGAMSARRRRAATAR
jgi:hypothetical protein